MRRRTGINQTDTIVNKLIQVVVETGMATGTTNLITMLSPLSALITVIATLAIIQVSMYTTIKNSNYYMTPACVLPKAYSNSLMVLLNNRSSLRLSAETITLRAAVPKPGTEVTLPIEVNIEQETFADVEGATTSDFTVTKASNIRPRQRFICVLKFLAQHTDVTLMKL